MREPLSFGPVIYFGPGACITCGRPVSEPYSLLHTDWCMEVRAENLRLQAEREHNMRSHPQQAPTNLSSDFQALVSPTFLNTG